MKFTLKCEHYNFPIYKDDTPKVRSTNTHEFQSETLNEILQEMEFFLRGAGFHFNGQLDFVDDSPVDDNPVDEENKKEIFYHPV